MSLRFWFLACFLFGISVAGAQTFSPDYDDYDDEPEEDVIAPQSNEPTNTEQEDADSEDNTPLVPAKVNIGGKQQAKVYDNKVGKVVEYKVVNGKIEFGDPNDRKVLVYTENYKVEKGLDGLARCSIRVYVLNDFKERINSLGFKLIWPEISTAIKMSRVNPGVKTYNDIMLLGDGCFSMDKTPTIEVNRCRVKGKSEEKCAAAIRWFKKDR